MSLLWSPKSLCVRRRLGWSKSWLRLGRSLAVCAAMPFDTDMLFLNDDKKNFAGSSLGS
jgi:hypothetical protein